MAHGPIEVGIAHHISNTRVRAHELERRIDEWLEKQPDDQREYVYTLPFTADRKMTVRGKPHIMDFILTWYRPHWGAVEEVTGHAEAPQLKFTRP